MRRRPGRLARELASWFLFAAALTVTRASLADHYKVPTGSMEPSVEPGDRIVVAKAAYGIRIPFTDAWLVRWADPSPGDVVVLDSPEDGSVLLKRVVALEGEVVEVRDGKLRIDGVPVAVDGTREHLGATTRFRRTDPSSGESSTTTSPGEGSAQRTSHASVNGRRIP